ncbi:MAG: serine hydrolase, partial [Burkholderiaceae bacterium]|nr:serine hydrolase [Burkholderiaceae bacterium]
MDKWLAAALDYLPRWLEYQMRATEQPGVVVAIVQAGRLIGEFAIGHADVPGGVDLTARHRMRVASHSKT